MKDRSSFNCQFCLFLNKTFAFGLGITLDPNSKSFGLSVSPSSSFTS